MPRGAIRSLVAVSAAAFSLAPLAIADARRPSVLPAPCDPVTATVSGLDVYTFASTTECYFAITGTLVGATFGILAIGGGGGGAANGGGGGGGGEARLLTNYTVPTGGDFVLKAGTGGTKGTGTGSGGGVPPGFGTDTTVFVSVYGAAKNQILKAMGGAGGTSSMGNPDERAAAGAGGTGGNQVATGRGGTISSPVSQGGNGEDGYTWALSADTYAGGGGGGICATLPVLPINIPAPAGGNRGGGAGAGQRPTSPSYSTNGSPGLPGTGSGGGGGAGCSGALANGASTSANGGNGGSGVIMLVVTALGGTTTTTVATSGATTTTTSAPTAGAATTTTVAAAVLPGAVTTTTAAVRPSTVTTAPAPTRTTAVTTTTVPGVASTVPGVTLAPSATTATTLTPFVPRADSPTSSVPEVVPSEPVFFGTARSLESFFDITLDVVTGSAVRGAPVSVAASGLLPTSTVRAVLRSDPVVLGEFPVDANGSAEFSVTLPDDIPPGTHTLSFEATSSDGTEVTSVTVFTVDGDGLAGSVVPPAEIVGAVVDIAGLERSVESGLPVYDTERHVARTAAIAATAAVVASLAGVAVTQATGGIPGGSMGVPASQSPRPEGGSGRSETNRATYARREDEEATDEAGEPEGPDEFEGTEANLLEDVDTDRDGWGDRHGPWRLPGYSPVDRFLRRAVPVMSTRSVLATRILQDGHWLRAATGVLSPLLWVMGLLLGAVAATDLNGVVSAPVGATVAVLVLLAMLDAMTGASAWAGFVVVALVTGSVGTLADLRTLLGLGVLLVALPSIGSSIRPFSRPRTDEGTSLIDRAGDYVVMPTLLAFVASTAYTSLNGLSGLEMVGSDDARALFVLVLVSAYVRLVGEDLVGAFFPRRSREVRVPVSGEQGAAARFATILSGAGLYLLAAAPFFGLGWRTWLTIGLLSLVPVLQLAEDSFPNFALIHRWFPRGLLRFVVMMFVTAWFGRLVLSVADDASDARSIAVFMLLPGVLVGIIDLVGRDGGEWKDSHLKQAGGFVVWLLAVAVLSGRITL
jgi:hypothetical protein